MSETIPEIHDPDSMRSVTRAAALLRALSTAPTEPLRLVDLASHTGLHKATCRRLLAALGAEGLVNATPTGLYELGSTAWLIGRAASQRWDIVELAAESLDRIARETGDVALLAVPVGTNAVCVDRREGDFPILPTSVKVGAIRPLGCAGHALALLCALPADEMARVMAATARERALNFKPMTDRYLMDKAAESRALGYALAEGEIVEGMAAMAVAVMDPWQRPMASLGFSAIASRMTPERRPSIAALFHQEVARIEAAFHQRIETGKGLAA